MARFGLPMRWVEKRIRTADSNEMDMVLQNVTSWHKHRYPEYELVIWSLPITDRQERERQIDIGMRYLRRFG